jgi:glycosyltransferase involved in cell wall biosynthesis
VITFANEDGMKIIYLSQVFPPEPGASIRALEQAVCLKRLGHDVTVITTMGYYPLGKVPPNFRRKLFIEETVKGIRVHRVWSLPAANTGVVRRVLSQVTFAWNAFFAALRIRNPDIVIASTHIFAVEAIAILLSTLKKCKSMIEFRDLLPECLELTGVSQNSAQAVFLRKYFNACFRWADFVTVPGQSMIPYLLKRGVENNKLLLLPHAAEPNAFSGRHPQLVRRSLALERKFVVLYAGSFSTYYEIPNMVEAARIISETCGDIHFVLVGDGQDSPRIKTLLDQFPRCNVTLTGHVAPGDVADYIMAADLCLTCRIGVTTPAFYHNYITQKVCDYLMAGKPVLAIENTPVLGDFLRETGTGINVKGRDPNALADAIINLSNATETLHEYSRSAKRYASVHLDRMKAVETFDEVLRARLGEAGCASKSA